MSQDSVELTVLLAVLAIVGGVIAAEIGRRGTRYAADLEARQAGRETQVSILTDFLDTVLNTAQAVQAYAFGVPAEQRRQRLHAGHWAEVHALFEPALMAVHRASVLSKSLLWPDITAAYGTCDEFFLKVIRGTDEEAELQSWGEVLYNEDSPIAVVVDLVGDRRREVLAGYRV